MSGWHGGKGDLMRKPLVSRETVSDNWDSLFKKQTLARCTCIKCKLADNIKNPRMVVCPECGNKRCPHASDHELTCTNSNEPGQPGSV